MTKVKIEKPKIIRILKPKLPKTTFPDLNALRALSQQVSQIQVTLNQLLAAQGRTATDVNQMRRDLFLSSLKSTLKNKKQIKKKMAAKKNKLLEKCGVKGKKAVLTTEDVERMKTRVDMV